MYTDGLTIYTAKESNTPSHKRNYRLTLPQRTWSGECVWSAPVRYLVDTDNSCRRPMTTNACTDNPAFDARMYVQSTFWKDNPCSGPVVLSSLGPVAIGNVNVNYLCAAQDLSRYLSSTDRYEDVVPPNEARKFNYTLPTDENGDADCAFDELLGIYRCADQVFGEEIPGLSLPDRCGFDDGHTKPPAPSYDETSGLCSNAVVDVLYNFTWLANDIVYLNATVILGDVPMFTTRNDVNFTTNVTQLFASVFVHDYTPVVDVNATEEDNNATTLRPEGRYERSGNPGWFQ